MKALEMSESTARRKRGSLIARRSWAFAAILLSTTWMGTHAEGVSAHRRPLPIKPEKTVLGPGSSPSRVTVKFRRNSAVRLHLGRLTSENETDLSRVEEVLERFSARPEPLISLSPDELREIQRLGEKRTGVPVPDMSLYFELSLSDENAPALCDALNALPVVEIAYPSPLPVEPPGNIPPETDDCRSEQGYSRPATDGTDPQYAWNFAGGRGEGVFVIDIEYDWQDDHEDLDSALGRKLVYEPRGLYIDHGTAVLGELIATDDRWGVTGQVPDALIGMVTQYPVGQSNSVSRAIMAATDLQEAGDVMLLETQTTGPNGNYCPSEWNQAVFDAIVNATAKGIVVVEAAGNGGDDLDGAEYLGRFDRSVRDSLAIIVGAGYSPEGAGVDRSRKSFSSYGSRLDVQGWGENVMTTGYNAYCGGGQDARQTYRRNFNGTSSASPMVAAAAAAVQGIEMARGNGPSTPYAVRALLAETGSPQQVGTYNGKIGPRPDLKRALRTLFSLIFDSREILDGAPDGNGDGAIDPGETVRMTICLHNGSETTAEGVSARLSSPRPEVLKILDDQADFGDVLAGETVCSSVGAYRLVAEPDAACGDAFRFDLTITTSVTEERSQIWARIGTDALCQDLPCAQADPVEEVTAVTVRKIGDDLRLEWNATSDAADYRVWRSHARDFTDARFAASPDQSGGTSATLPGEAAPSPQLSTYQVRGINTCGWEGP